jgi:hypothetical protein
VEAAPCFMPHFGSQGRFIPKVVCILNYIISQCHEGSSKGRKILLASTGFMFLMNTGLFIANIANTLTLFSWAQEVITENTPPLKTVCWHQMQQVRHGLDPADI